MITANNPHHSRQPARNMVQCEPNSKADWPHLDRIRDPEILRAEHADVRQQYNTVRLHAAIGYVTPADEHHGRGPRIRAARKRGLRHARWDRIIYHRLQKAKANRRSPTNVD
ncbi:MAG: hypothetical protein M3065_10835 [Actinomycetota bacterium]|nr:hypothetical protein [Actinomycetota bacterium]